MKSENSELFRKENQLTYDNWYKICDSTIHSYNFAI
jgi:hypothetical protein